ncbi:MULTISPECIES: TetR/AcrR family transcriptional regulator [Mycobacterium]|uniref:TetR/AcrR family transcriptional regulator n=1 Tax=Mycobacterium intracellulare subsp. chimaera TaxID=222805 RepID=A0ABT7NVZ0_MYCIT|nr:MULTISPECIES: TetR/AcrR family transcriptional regulator [Mycobacterium]MCA2275133.1 TetR/AcrR family transcriptional regulator [Mycobacterium intracellulare]MCA2326237.1 TetR/AcrR family transcriptional regulator [Mycobacterium intracellulare]MDM3924783.1 TetR/AcrR family transcriptional regulator [Mycobacterium intracellulare subsp. chimaera]OSC25786.1 TetR family transcriptional regulator [Mycobacterium paraintracellulare]WRU82244.1 TetR/AcrR family transcriptional regulator [Mycobacteri
MLPRGTRRPGRPPAAKADETRKRIIQAARLVFSERGYDGATFQAIASRADLTRPAINHYFSSKRALYREVLEDTNEFVIAAGIKEADAETGLVARLTAFISVAVRANSENPAGSAFLISGVLESQRHPDLTGTDNSSVRVCREFLLRAVNDAIENGELAADVDASALVETLLVIICGVGLYSGYVESYQQMLAVTGMLRQLLEGALWRPGA